MNDIPSSPSAAKKADSKYYFTGKPCPKGHISKRWACNGTCYECTRENAKKHQKDRSDLRASRSRRWRGTSKNYLELNRLNRKRFAEKNPERSLEIGRNSYAKHREKNILKAREYREVNADQVRERDRIRSTRPDRRASLNEKNGYRRALERNATPPWLNDEHRKYIRNIYKQAKIKSEETGVPHHVDHIHPLAGENFCGLHVPWNLQILPCQDNLKKSNRLLDESISLID